MLLIKTHWYYISHFYQFPQCVAQHEYRSRKKPFCSWLGLMDASTQLPLLFPFAIKLTWRARHQGEGLVSWLPVSLAGREGGVSVERLRENGHFQVCSTRRNAEPILQ